MPREYFPRVKEAREALKEKALDLFHLQVKLIMDAAIDGNFKAALEANQWLMEHIPAEEGVRMLDATQDLEPKKDDTKQLGPTIQIGIQLGGVGNPSTDGVRDSVRQVGGVGVSPTNKALPEATVIDVTPTKDNP